MIRYLAIALPLALAPLPAVAQEAIALNEQQQRDLRCGVVFALAEGFAETDAPGFETYSDPEGRGEEFFVDTMIGIGRTNNLEAAALVPLVERQIGQFSDDPALVLAALPDCLVLLDDAPAAEPRVNS